VVALYPVNVEMVLHEGAKAAAISAAKQLSDGGMSNSDDEGDEVEDFGPDAVDPGRFHLEVAPAIWKLAFEVHCAERAARRASSNNPASYAMTENSCSANDRVTDRSFALPFSCVWESRRAWRRAAGGAGNAPR